MTSNVYALPVPEDGFRNACGGNLGGENETCVSFQEVNGVMILRDSKPEGAGQELRFTRDEWSAFMATQR